MTAIATRHGVTAAVGRSRGSRTKCSAIPAVRLGSLEGFETTVVSYTTDIPAFGGAWGEPFLFGPGTIHVAHTTEERVPKRQLVEACTKLYQRIASRNLLGVLKEKNYATN